MASVLYGDQSALGALVYTPMSERLSEFIEQSNARVMDCLSDYGRRFMEKARSIRSRASYDRVLAVREQSERAIRQLYDEDSIRSLSKVTEIQLAKPKMRRYILAEPSLRQMYRDKLLSGWDGVIEDDISRPLDETPEYLHATNGIQIDHLIRYVSNDELEQYEDLEPLSIAEQADILHTWECTKRIIQVEKLDPTSLWDASL